MEPNHLEKVFSSYLSLGKSALDAASSATADDAHGWLRYFLVDMSVVPVLLGFHSVFAALGVYRLTGGRQFWLKSLVLTMFAAFGGSTMASVLSGQAAPLFTTGSNVMMTYVTVAWYVVNHMGPVRRMLNMRPIRALIAFGAMAAKSRSIMSFVDKIARQFPDAVVGAVVLGGVSGCGGSLLMSVERMVQRGASTPSELSAPGWGLKSAFVAASVYYVGTDPTGWIARAVPFEFGAVDRADMRVVVSLALCTHAALETLYGRHVNPLFLLEELFFAVSGVEKYGEGVGLSQTVEAAGAGAGVQGGEGSAGGGSVGSGATEKSAEKGAVMKDGIRRRAGKGRSG